MRRRRTEEGRWNRQSSTAVAARGRVPSLLLNLRGYVARTVDGLLQRAAVCKHRCLHVERRGLGGKCSANRDVQFTARGPRAFIARKMSLLWNCRPIWNCGAVAFTPRYSVRVAAGRQVAEQAENPVLRVLLHEATLAFPRTEALIEEKRVPPLHRDEVTEPAERQQAGEGGGGGGDEKLLLGSPQQALSLTKSAQAHARRPPQHAIAS